MKMRIGCAFSPSRCLLPHEASLSLGSLSLSPGPFSHDAAHLSLLSPPAGPLLASPLPAAPSVPQPPMYAAGPQAPRCPTHAVAAAGPSVS